MAFVTSSLIPLRSAFIRTPLISSKPIIPTHSPRPRPSMSLASNLSFPLKVALATGAIVLVTFPLLSTSSDAAIFHFRGERPKNIGLRYNRYLDSCPSSPNCISSSANAYDSHFVPPWTYDATDSSDKKSMQDAIQDVTQAIQDYPRTTIIENKPTESELGKGHYIYVEFESKLMGFVDDVEFFFQPDGKTVEYRSASRLGEKDFDANRKRIRDLRVALQEKDKRWASVGYN